VAAFLFKTEPGSYSFADLVRDRRTVWEGVANAQALIHLRAVKKGDSVVVYHTGAEKAAVGLARAASAPYPDPRLGDPRRVVVDLVPVGAFAHPVPLAAFRTDPALEGVALVRNTRLSVMPLRSTEVARVLKLGGAKR
jgi:predicted RNA-binding protein with PUA-like domain